MVKDTKYYLFFVVYNSAGPGGGNLMISNVTDAKLKDFYNSWSRFILPDQATLDEYEYKPSFIGIPDIDLWRGDKEINVNPSNWKLIKYSKGNMIINSNAGQGKECPTCDINKILFDYDDTTEYRVEWYPSNTAVAFTHNFVIDLAKITKFSFIKITGAKNSGWFKMNSSIEIRTAEKQLFNKIGNWEASNNRNICCCCYCRFSCCSNWSCFVPQEKGEYSK